MVGRSGRLFHEMVDTGTEGEGDDDTHKDANGSPPTDEDIKRQEEAEDAADDEERTISTTTQVSQHPTHPIDDAIADEGKDAKGCCNGSNEQHKRELHLGEWCVD